jgi:WD40 repeat protein
MADAPILLSWDVGGSICVWDLATTDFHHMLFLPHDLRGCVQCVVPVMRRHVLYFVGPRYVMPLDFSISSFPHLADDEPIIGAHYSDAYSMIATATSRTIRLWNAKNGRMLRTFEPPVASHIVSLSTDPSGKKLFLCTSAGVAYRLDFASGIITHEYTPHGVTTEQHVVSAAGIQEVKHSYERREVAAAVYVPEDCALVTCGWDAKIILHDDINDCAQGKTSLRLMEAHRKDLNCVAVSWPCRLIAAAGVEGFISCWDYEQPGGKMFDFCMGHTMDTTALAFLDPYPLLSSCDSSGNIAIWIVPPFHPSSMQCVHVPLFFFCCRARFERFLGTCVYLGQRCDVVQLPSFGSIAPRVFLLPMRKAPYTHSTYMDSLQLLHSTPCPSDLQPTPANCACASMV